MKQVEAVIPSEILDDVKERLCLVGIRGMTICPVAVLAPPKAHAPMTAFIERVRLIVLAVDDHVETIVNAIVTVAKRGGHDGQIIIYPLDAVFRIRTGEADADAL